MPSTTTIPGDQNWYFGGNLAAKSMTIPAGAVGDEQIEASAMVAATKLVHQHAARYVQAGGSDVVAVTVPLHTFRGAGEIVAVEVVPLVAPNGGDKAFTVDVLKGNQATPFATVLTAPISVADAQGDREVVSGTLATTEAADGDTLEAVVAVSGTTGTQGQGFVLTVWVREEP